MWEYKIDLRKAWWDEEPQEWLNRLGAEGWELVSNSTNEYIFKRSPSYQLDPIRSVM